MKHLKLLGVALAAVFALGISTATTAFALPDVSLTLCTAAACYPLHLEVTLLTVATTLSNASGANLEGIGLLLLLLTSTLSSLGTFEALFDGVKNKEGEKCHSVTDGTIDPAGEVLTHGTYHIVYTRLGTTSGGVSTSLLLGLLFLVEPFEIICGGTNTEIRGSVLSSLDAGSNEAAELTETGGQLLGNGKGKPALTNYYNQAGTGVAPKLEENTGSGFASAAEEVNVGLVLLKALKTNMFVITSR